MAMDFSELFDSSALERKFKLIQISSAKREEFYLLLASFVKDGIPVKEALESMDVELKECKDARSLLTSSILLELRGGGQKASFTVGQALSGLVPTMEAITIDAGESGGDLASGFERAAELSRNNSKIKSTVKSALTYPAILFVMIGFALWMMKTQFIPAMRGMAPVEIWPASAQRLAVVSDNTEFIFGGIVLAIASILVTFVFTKSAWIGSQRDFFDKHIFPWSISRSISAASILASIASLMRMGVPLNDALDRMERAASLWESSHFMRIRARMKLGQREGEAISEDLFDRDERWKIILYGNLVDFSSAMEKMSKSIMERVIANVEITFGIIRNIMLFAVGGLVLWMYGSFMSVTMAARSASQVM